MPRHVTTKDLSNDDNATPGNPDMAVSEHALSQMRQDTETALATKADNDHMHIMAEVDELENELENKQPHSEHLDALSGVKKTDSAIFASRGKGWFAMGWGQLKFMLGIDKIDNTSDKDKPISSSTATALFGKSDKGHHHEVSDIDNLMINYQKRIEPTMSTGDFYSGTKTYQPLNKTAVGLPNVDNTSDVNKPVSTAQQTALNAKSNTNHKHVVADTQFLQQKLDEKEYTITEATSGDFYEGTKTFQPKLSLPISTATQTALDAKANTTHTHTVAQVTGLQAFLDDKASKDDNLKMYLSGVKKNQPKMAVCTATVTSGTVTFNLTNDNTSTGTALFTNVFLESVQVEAYGVQVFFGTPTLAGNKKTISFPASQITTVLGLLSISTAANGIACRLMIMGD